MSKHFPKLIPVFPLSGVIYFPKTNLPLNIFEQRYLDLINDCLKNNKLLGMIQSKKNDGDVYSVGCLGQINDYQKSADGRILVNLKGLTRFEVLKEVKNTKLYRQFEVSYEKFAIDFNDKNNNELDLNALESLLKKAKKFFKKNGLLLNWKEFEKLDHYQQINTLAMISPISNEEKQKLLESINLNDKAEILSEIMEFYLFKNSSSNTTMQ
jgi:Lon protease-like protein